MKVKGKILRLSRKDGEYIVTIGESSGSEGGCLVVGSSDDPGHPWCESDGCGGSCELKSKEQPGGVIEFWCDCKA